MGNELGCCASEDTGNIHVERSIRPANNGLVGQNDINVNEDSEVEEPPPTTK